MTDKQKILNHLRNTNDWIPNYNLQSKELSTGWVGSAGGRRCRELYESGLIERKLIGKIAHYKAKEVKRVTYNIINQDKQVVNTLKI